jgi:hypothetical protein
MKTHVILGFQVFNVLCGYYRLPQLLFGVAAYHSLAQCFGHQHYRYFN